MITNVLEDISTLTSVSENTLKKFIPVINYIIGHGVHEALCEKTEYVNIDLEIGELHIKIEDDSVRYRFVPSKDLEYLICNTIKTKQSPIMSKVDYDLQQRIDKAYKELL